MQPIANDADLERAIAELLRLLDEPWPANAELPRPEALVDAITTYLAQVEETREPSVPGLGEAWREQFDAALRRQAAGQRKPTFGSHAEGIGPTLGMDVSNS
jgi:antitoxin component HigA of HigAB toxin-antitoxin module